MTTKQIATNHILSWARQHGVKPRRDEIPALQALIESIPAEIPAGVDFYSDRLHLLKKNTPTHDRLKSLGFPDGPKFGYAPYCTVPNMGAPTQIQTFCHQPHPDWIVLQFLVMAEAPKRHEIYGKLIAYLRTGNQ